MGYPGELCICNPVTITYVRFYVTGSPKEINNFTSASCLESKAVLHAVRLCKEQVTLIMTFYTQSQFERFC